MASCEPGADNTFGPVVASCARSFDFTLLFEQSILSIVPNAVFLLFAASRLWVLLHVPIRTTKHGWASIAKVTVACLLVIIQLVLLLLYTVATSIEKTTSLAATVLAMCVAILVAPLSYLEHHRSVRPSTLLNSYLALSIILDIPQVRTLYLLQGHGDLAGVFSAAVGVKAVMLLLEAWSKRSSLNMQYQALPVETTSSILSRGLFVWMNSLFIQGFRKVISFEDLGAIDNKLDSATIHRRIHNEWSKQDRHLRWPLLRSLWRALRWSILSTIPARLCYSGFIFAQPFLIRRATDYLAQSRTANDIGYGLIAATGCIYVGIAISTAFYKHQLYRHITLARGALVALIYSETLSTEQTLGDPSAVLTLMSTDVDRICQSLNMLPDLWSRPLELVVGTTLLALQIGWVSAVPLIVVLLSITADSRVTMMIGGKVRIWNDAVQQRISLTADVLGSLRIIKTLGLTRPIHTMLQSERLRELRFQVKFRHSTVWLNTLGNVPTALAAAVTFIAYAIKARVEGSASLNASDAFTSLALISLVTTPAAEILTAYPAAASCIGCLSRIEAHLMKPQAHGPVRDVTEMGDISKKPTSGDSGISLSKFRMLDGSDDILRNLGSILPPGSVTFILGPSGSGKSTFLRAVVSELRHSEPMRSRGGLVYCEQTPWLFTGTVRENICGANVETFDEDWYQTIVAACALHRELVSLPRGDLTHIDGQGAILNGGQKQRIVLARALYQRPRFIVLDNLLSASGLQTQRMVMKRLLGRDGLLRKLHATAVIAAPTARYAAIADNLITIDGERTVSLVQKTARMHESIFETDADEPEHITESKTTGTVDERDKALEDAPQSNMAERLRRNDSDFSDYAYYFKSMSWTWVVLFFLSATVQTVCYYMSQVILQWWTADGGLDIAKWTPPYLILACGNAVFFGVTVCAMFLKLVPESSANLHRTLLDTVTNATYLFLAKADVGVLLNRFSQDMTLIENQLPTGVLCTTIYLFWTVGSLALICNGSRWMALTVPAVLLTLFFIQWIYLRTSRRLRVIELELRSPLYSHFLETIKGLNSIRSLHWERQFTESMIKKLDDSQIPYYLLYCAQRWLQLVLDLVIAALALIVMTLSVNLRTSTNPGSLGLSLNNILSFNEILSTLLQYWTLLEISLGSIARIREFETDTPEEKTPSIRAQIPPPWPTHGSIELRNVTAGYSTANDALDNITMSIEPGEMIGICGRPGSGKTSLLLSISRLLELSQGSITIDGINLSTIPHGVVRERIITVPKEPFLVQQRTIRFNIDPSGEHSDAQIISAFAKVLLWGTLEKKGGLDTLVTSELLSQSEKQLFSLARAILRKMKHDPDSSDAAKSEEKQKHPESHGHGVLLLDEPLNRLDPTRAKAMWRVIRDEFSGYTVVAVAGPQPQQRLDSVLVDSDRVAVMEGGRLVEFDRPGVLLAERSSAFMKFYGTGVAKEDEEMWD
ncbi:uncharacterized protein Z520_06579 [Fonsecaea multimorphosa CBS 102226]|uniref:ABC transporter domain-containing protein n=1 Tax=Fonsecaea multimorphosa CBS 102226 TaxID=1442371 RepID=A0A0D2IL97_9EURO|nr:uncharacterized protein Z520_06579 [Fonsecaea multimorphosa CBS 102226]KIX97801.1 hypothetical protein Z520_06579 [Fonsecaea multimorphosa CBS 102226]OAL23821.1 hypothetical protein AYO22_06140 [Fonsecaea multimorphosa]